MNCDCGVCRVLADEQASTSVEEMLMKTAAQDKVTAETVFSALMKICVYLARQYGFKIRPVNMKMSK